jgi:N-glycosylase/DNA lyase
MAKKNKNVEQRLLKELKANYKTQKSAIKSRLKEFKALQESKYFQELTFCILTPQSNAQKCWQAVEQLNKIKNPDDKSIKQISKILKSKTRFHNNKARYIKEVQEKWKNISKLINNSNNSTKTIQQIRNELADNNSPNKIKGFGLKEASHFLRNIGKSSNKIAILDRHILRNMKRLGIIKEDKVKNTKDYLKKEKLFINFAHKMDLTADELDLLLWSRENGEIFK